MTTKTYTMQEFGRSIQVSKELFKDELLPPKFNEELKSTVSSHMCAALEMLNRDFEMAKAKYFPNWDEATYELKEGPLIWIVTIVRVDGSTVPDDICDAWIAWYYWDEYDKESPGIQPTFTYPKGYTTRTRYQRQFAWYAVAPVEEELG